MNSDDIYTIFGCIISLAVLGGFIALLVFLINKSNQENKNSELSINQIIQHLPQDKQMIFFMQFNNVRKNPTSAILLALFLGGVGGHKFYMGQTGLGILYLLFCWTYIPGIVAFVELFTLSGQVSKYNEQKAREISMMIGR